MNICVLNGSPRGGYSTTLHTALYLQKRYPRHSFEIVEVATRIRALENDMTPALEAMGRAELILFSYPVYTFLAPSQLHRFLAVLKQTGVDLKGKFATQITTSKHFYDVTAHRYVEDNCFDLGLRVIHGLSADMEDLTKPEGRADAERFFEYALWCVEHGVSEPPPAISPRRLSRYIPAPPRGEKRREGFDVVIVADLRPDDERLAAMINDFHHACPYPTRLVNIAQYPFQGGCLGCFHCAGDGTCIYKDGFDAFLRENIQGADAVVYAFTIRDHSMGPVFKMFDDRQFCNGHRTVTEGMPFAYLVNGDYEAEPNLRTVIEARSEVGHNFLAGVGFDPASVQLTVRRLSYALEHGYLQPRNFYGVGGMKIFRDLIWLMRGLMHADHKFYKAHGVYDFPQKRWPEMVKMCFLGALVRNPKVRAKMGGKLDEGMAAPYEKVVQEAVPKQE